MIFCDLKVNTWKAKKFPHSKPSDTSSDNSNWINSNSHNILDSVGKDCQIQSLMPPANIHYQSKERPLPYTVPRYFTKLQLNLILNCNYVSYLSENHLVYSFWILIKSQGNLNHLLKELNCALHTQLVSEHVVTWEKNILHHGSF